MRISKISTGTNFGMPLDWSPQGGNLKLLFKLDNLSPKQKADGMELLDFIDKYSKYHLIQYKDSLRPILVAKPLNPKTKGFAVKEGWIFKSGPLVMLEKMADKLSDMHIKGGNIK